MRVEPPTRGSLILLAGAVTLGYILAEAIVRWRT